jgi:hypothetical protein
MIKKMGLILFILIITSCSKQSLVDSKTSPMALPASNRTIPGHGGPAPHYLDQRLFLDQKVTEAGSSMKITVDMTAYENISFSGSPIVKISPAGEMQPLQSVKVSNFPKLTFSKGEKASSEITIQSPSNPGYYRVDLEFHLTSGTTLTTMEDFFVKYSQGDLRNGEIEVNQSIYNEGHTLKVDHISMTDRETVVKFSFKPGTHGIESTLTTDQGKKLVPLMSTPYVETGLMEATFTFAPTTIGTKSLTFNLTKSQKATPQGIVTELGDWKITINFITPSKKND